MSIDPSLLLMNRLYAVQSMENLYTAAGQGADGALRSDLQDMGRQSPAPQHLMTCFSHSGLPVVIPHHLPSLHLFIRLQALCHPAAETPFLITENEKQNQP